MSGSTSKIHDECHDQETDDCDDLDAGKDKLGFAINGYSKDVKAEYDNDDDRYPCSNADILCSRPELDNGGRS